MKIEFAEDFSVDSTACLTLVRKGGCGALMLSGALSPATATVIAVAQAQKFDGEAGMIIEHFADADGQLRKIILVGIGEGSPTDCEKAGAAVSARYLTIEAALNIDVGAAAPETVARNRFISALVLRGWRYDRYRTKLPEKQKAVLETIRIVGAPARAQAEWADAAAVVRGVSFTRGLVTEPANVIYPESFVERCQELVSLGVEITVLDEHLMAALGMGALLGVSLGSARPPRLLVMRWDGTNGAVKTPLALVGKGVTFDTGGISLKPPAGMEDMKWDMGGAGAVAGTMLALAARKAQAHVVGVCGLVENMPDGKAQRPGDVVTSLSGQTIEVINTDAEGRLVLCDALTWVQRTYKPAVIIDLATLTGAIITSLGHEFGGIFSNDDGLADQLLAAGVASGDPLWRFPLTPAYDKLIDSQIADIRNIGPREAGSITAAQFLKRFINDSVKWAHLDIAGMVWAAKPGAVWDKGATGYGVRLLDQYVSAYCEAGPVN